MRTSQGRRPDFLIIGAQKAGTTTLSRLLAQVKGVATPHGESPHLESPHFEMGGARRLFHELGNMQPEGGVVGIKRPNYLPSPVVPGRVADLLPDAHVVAVLRDPVSRAFSAYLHYAEYNLVPVKDPNDGLRRLLTSVVSRSSRAYEILDWGLYTQHLESWTACIDKDHLHVITQPAMLANPQGVLGTLPFLDGLDVTAARPSHANEGATSLAELRARSVMHRMLTPHDPTTQALRPRTRNPLRLALAGLAREVAHQEIRAHEGGRLRMAPDVREMLESYYTLEKDSLRVRYAIEFKEGPT